MVELQGATPAAFVAPAPGRFQDAPSKPLVLARAVAGPFVRAHACTLPVRFERDVQAPLGDVHDRRAGLAPGPQRREPYRDDGRL